ncbi:MAG: PilZ domain-containing protein [Wolinella sp.]
MGEAIQEFRRYFETFDVVYIQDQCGSSDILPMFRAACPKMREFRLYEPTLLSTALDTMLVVIEIPRPIQDDISRIKDVLQNANYWDCLILSDDYKNHMLARLAFTNNVADLLPRKLKESDIVRVMRFLINKLINHRKEKLLNNYYRQLIDQDHCLFFIRKNGKTLFANRAFQRYCGVTQTADIDSLSESELPMLGVVSELKSGTQMIWRAPVGDECFIVQASSDEGRDEILYTCYRINEGLYKEEVNEPLTRMKFIEELKDRLVISNVNDESLYILTIRIENSQKIIDEYGALAFHDLSKDLMKYTSTFTEEDGRIYSFWQRDMMVLLLDTHDIAKVKKRVMRLFQAIPTHEFSHQIVPFCELVILDFIALNPNDSIHFLDRFYEKNHTAMENQRLLIRLSSASQGEDGERPQAMFYLEILHNKEQVFRIINLYKGLSIQANSKILKIKSGDIYIKADNIQRYLMSLEKRVAIESADLPGDISAQVKYVDKERDFAVISMPDFMEGSLNGREYVRVQCDIRIPIVLTSGRYAYTGEVADLSIQAIAIRYRSTISRNILQTPAKLAFALPNINTENSLVKVTINGKIVAIKNDEDGSTRVVVMISPKPPEDGYLLEYIYTRQKELMQEIKRVGNMLFKKNSSAQDV